MSNKPDAIKMAAVGLPCPRDATDPEFIKIRSYRELAKKK